LSLLKKGIIGKHKKDVIELIIISKFKPTIGNKKAPMKPLQVPARLLIEQSKAKLVASKPFLVF
jgi:hypothetical protein